MYRAKVQAVSGSKVFADGKWLKCIGNKPVSVGEYIYTDGHVVFGNYTIPQTPLLSSPQEDTVIPIVTAKRFNKSIVKAYYVFYKGKLRPVPSPNERLVSDSIFAYNKKAKSFLTSNYLIFPSEIVFLYVDNWGRNIETEKSCSFDGVLASNVNKSGNLFVLYIKNFSLYIKQFSPKNGVTIVKTVDFEYLIDEVNSLVPQPPDRDIDVETDGHEHLITVFDHSTLIYLKIEHCFIEDQNNWSAFFTFQVSKETWANKGGSDRDTISEANIHYHLSDKGIEHDSPDIYTYDSAGFVVNYLPEPNPDMKVPLQDGFYFKEAFQIEIVAYYDDGTYVFRYYIKRSIFSPKDVEIFSGLFPYESKIVFGKVKEGYLMAVVGDERFPSDYTENFKIKMGLPYFIRGIFLLRSNQWIILSEKTSSEICLNQRLIPMKKISNWTKHIQDVSFDE